MAGAPSSSELLGTTLLGSLSCFLELQLRLSEASIPPLSRIRKPLRLKNSVRPEIEDLQCPPFSIVPEHYNMTESRSSLFQTKATGQH